MTDKADPVSLARGDRAAVDKAISLLVAFGAQAATGVGVSELARRTGLSKSTAFRVLGLLERNGVVEKVDREYRLGVRLHELGRSVYAPDHDRIRDELIPFVTDLYEATHETVHLAALHGTDVVYLAKLYGHRQVDSPSRIGGRVPAFATAVGKALLAHDSDALALVEAQRLVRFTTGTVPSHTALRSQLELIRRDGLASEREEVRPGLACLAGPVYGPGGRAIAAISLSMPVTRLDEQAMGHVLRRVTAAASLKMGRSRPARRAPISA